MEAGRPAGGAAQGEPPHAGGGEEAHPSHPQAFDDNRKERALQAGHSIIASFKGDDWRAGYGTLYAWHKEYNPVTFKSCYSTLEDQTRERVELYRKRAPPDDCISSRANRPPLCQATKKSNNRWTGGASKMRAEDLKGWLRRTEEEERAQKKGVLYASDGRDWLSSAPDLVR